MINGKSRTNQCRLVLFCPKSYLVILYFNDLFWSFNWIGLAAWLIYISTALQVKPYTSTVGGRETVFINKLLNHSCHHPICLLFYILKSAIYIYLKMTWLDIETLIHSGIKQITFFISNWIILLTFLLQKYLLRNKTLLSFALTCRTHFCFWLHLELLWNDI